MKLFIAAIALIAALFGAWVYHNHYQLASAKPNLTTATVFTQPRIINSFQLIDAKNQPFSEQNLKGHWSLLFFGFSNCPDLCPTTLATLNQAYKKLAAQERNLPQVVFISVDPERDTPERLSEYLSSFNPHFLGATGLPTQVDQLTHDLSVLYTKNGESIDHSGTILIINPEGQFYGVFTMPHDANKIAADIKQLLAATPSADIRDNHGRLINLSDYRGQWIIVNYWATWCQPCLKELPELNTFYQQNRQRALVLGVSYDGLAKAEINQLAQTLHLQFPLLQKFPLKRFGIQNIPALPVTFLIDPQGQLHETLHGPQTATSLQKHILMHTRGEAKA